MEIKGRIIDIEGKKIFKGVVRLSEGKIISVEEINADVPEQFILPGFIDAHVHIESSMLTPSEFARLAVVHGTVSTVSDPHEIGNVLGKAGVMYMIEDGKKTNFKFYFGAPSCVPATPFETAGSTISVNEIEELFQLNEVKYLAEMMNWPGVLNNDPEVLAKISLAHKMNKQVDGHAPGLKGGQAKKYIDAGITTDHECFTKEEALDKLSFGMKVIIREGSAARNFDALADLLHEHYENMMFCSDDKHPDSLVEGHINKLVERALAKGVDLFKVLQAACLNPITHYGLGVGRLRPGDPADFIIVDNFKRVNVLRTYINGINVAENGTTKLSRVLSPIVNNFNTSPIDAGSLALKSSVNQIRVIEAHDGELVTTSGIEQATKIDGNIVPDVSRDILKLVVVNRYENSRPAIGFIKNFGLSRGAIASSVAHDSHNIIAVGTNDNDIAKVINLVIEEKGGIAAINGVDSSILPLPIAGLMSDLDGYEVAKKYSALDVEAKQMGSRLSAPFMTLSFMALLVIPELKLSDQGLFDGIKFEFVDVEC
ncbi:MAG TPA: adenine deaminase [Cyclobacteriaceae bacterium]|jgi:adenine deaminase